MYECVTYAGSAEDKEYNFIESEAHQKLFDYIRSNTGAFPDNFASTHKASLILTGRETNITFIKKKN